MLRSRDAGVCPFLFEVLPPPVTWSEAARKRYAERVARSLGGRALAGINIPEVRNEARTKPRRRFVPKEDPRSFAVRLREAFRERGWGAPMMVVNRCVPYAPREEQWKWFEEAHSRYGLHAFVVVGPETRARAFPGPDVSETLRFLREKAFPTALGAITIPTRRRSDLDEPERMRRKVRAGADFFTSQVLMEAESVIRLLRDYAGLLRRHREEPARVFLAVAPVRGERDVRFLEWLGVEIPGETRKYLLESERWTVERSFHVAENLVRRTLDWLYGAGVRVPVGILVEHIMRRNVDLSVELLERLRAVVRGHPYFGG